MTEVCITFNKPPQTLFRRQEEVLHSEHNQLIIRIQPDEGLLLSFGMKVPGDGFKVKNVGMDFHYSDLADNDVPEAYERLLLDCMRGDATLYAHGDSVEYTWEFVEPILNAGSKACRTLKDRWTVVTRDGRMSAQWEHTIVVTSDGCEILTDRGD